MRRGRHDHAIGAQFSRSLRQIVRTRARTGELLERDGEIGGDLGSSQVEHRERPHLDAPEAPPLVGGVDRTVCCSLPLRPHRRGIERRVQRPRLSRPVIPPLGNGRTVGRKRGRVETGLAVDRPAELGDRVQT